MCFSLQDYGLDKQKIRDCLSLSCLLKFTTHWLKVNCVLQQSGREKESGGKMTCPLSVEATQHCLRDGGITGIAILFCYHLFIDGNIVWIEPQWFFHCFPRSWMTYSISLRYLCIMCFAFCSPLLKSSTTAVRWKDQYQFFYFSVKYIICSIRRQIDFNVRC